MADLGHFNAGEVEPMDDFEALPPGRYAAAIVSSEMKPTRAGNGSYLALVFEILEGPAKERRLWVRLNLDNPNPLTVKLARRELSSVCRATGVMTPRDSSELHGIPMEIAVSRRTDECGILRNGIRSYGALPAKPDPGTAGPVRAEEAPS